MHNKIAVVAICIAAFAMSAAAQTAVTTSGTTSSGTVPVFNGAATVTNSPITVSGSNVGIGTTSPQFNLDMQTTSTTNSLALRANSGAAWTSALIQRIDPGTGAGTLIFSEGYGGSTMNWVYEPSGHNINMMSLTGHGYTAANTLLTVNGSGIFSGNLGIGTFNPGYKLDVSGGQVNSSGGYCISGSCITSWPQAASNTWSGTQTFSGAASFGSVSEPGILNTSGYLGIGTTTPISPLTVLMPSWLVNQSSGLLTLGYNSATANAPLTFNKATLVNIIGAGTMIGNASPSIGMLQLNVGAANMNQVPSEISLGATRATSASTAGTVPVQGGDTLGRVGFYGDDGHNTRSKGAFIESVVDTSQIAVGTGTMPASLNLATASSAPIIFYTNAYGTSDGNFGPVTFSPNERMRIDYLGNVGIGTTAPASMLSVGPSSQFQVSSV
ncbi:MAG: hypothetical protein WCA21_15460, partial [Terracidiphilus sp.]